MLVPGSSISPEKALIILCIFLFMSIAVVLDIIYLIRYYRNRPDWSSILARLRSRPWDLTHASWLVLLLMTLTIAGRKLSVLAVGMGVLPADGLMPATVIIQTALFHIPLLVFVAMYLKRSRKPLAEAFGITTTCVAGDIRKGFLFYVLMMPPVFLVNLLATLALNAMGFIQEPQYPVEIITGNYPVWARSYIVFMAIVIAPVTEEILFRGISLPAAAKKTGLFFAIVATAALFSLVHFNTYAVAPLFAVATAFSLAYAATGSILSAMTMHFLFNFFSIAFLLIQDYLHTLP